MKEIFCSNCGKKRKWYATLKSDLCRVCQHQINKCEKCGQLKGAIHKCASVDEKGNRFCTTCNKLLRNNGRERYSKLCIKCSKKEWREKEKVERIILRIKFGGKCKECGYNKCFAALHFHHIYASEKYKWNNKGKTGAALSEIKSHPERFELLCSRCHVERHYPEECYTKKQIETFAKWI